MTPLLDVRGLTVRYGSSDAVSDVSLQVDRAALVGLIGPNGAGKTSLLDAVSGFVPAAAGQIRFDGSDITEDPPHARARVGLGRTWQAGELFDELTVRENVELGWRHSPWWAVFADLVRPERGERSSAPAHAIELMGLGPVADRLPTEIPNGTRRLVAIARALAGRPALLLLDEPAAGLDTDETELLSGRLRTIVDEGIAVLLVDHDVGLTMSVCDRMYVLDFGRCICSGPPADVQCDQAVIDAYLGVPMGGSIS